MPSSRLGRFAWWQPSANSGKRRNSSSSGRCRLAVLAYLVQHPGRVIPIEEIRTAVWGDTRVGRGAIRVCVREIRQALGDEAASPQYIETVGRQGYRFLGARPAGVTARAPSGAVPQEGTALARVAPLALFVGRHRELAQLQQWFTQAQQGQRQVVLVSGEPGIGKTTARRSIPATSSV